MVLKEKGDRVREAITILKKLQEIGLTDIEPGYRLTKSALDIWISNGESREEKIEFARHGRTGYLSLPALQGKHASFLLKAVKEEAQE
jgi:hypothetical protein